MATLTSRWATVLTVSQRQSWDRYALAVPRPDRLGRQTNPGGLPHYIRTNIPRIQADETWLPTIDTAPIPHDLGSFGPVQPVYLDLVENTVIIWYPLFDDWLRDDDSAMLVYASPVKPHTVNFYKGPYRYLGYARKGRSAFLYPPLTLKLPDSIDSASREHLRARVTRDDGRLSADQRFPADPATADPPVCIGFDYYLPSPDRWIVTFDQQLHNESMPIRPWRLVWNNNAHSIGSVTWAGDHVIIRAAPADWTPLSNRVLYLPTWPPAPFFWDLHSEATRLAVDDFTFIP